jgi:hypothetical protein
MGMGHDRSGEGSDEVKVNAARIRARRDAIRELTLKTKGANRESR